MTEGPLCPLCHTPSVLRHACRSPSAIPAGPLRYTRWSPLSYPPVPPLSFPPVVSGNPVFFSSVPSFGWPAWEKAMDSRLKMSGMTERAIEHVEHDGRARSVPFGIPPYPLCPPSCLPVPLRHTRWSPPLYPLVPSVIPAGPPLSYPRVLSVIPAGTLCHTRGSLSVIPAGPPSVIPAGS